MDEYMNGVSDMVQALGDLVIGIEDDDDRAVGQQLYHLLVAEQLRLKAAREGQPQAVAIETDHGTALYGV